MEFLLLFAGIIALVSFLFHSVIESSYMMLFNKPLYVHFYLYRRKLRISQQSILKNEFSFYQKLSPKQRCYFEHRVATFIRNYQFVGKEDLELTEQMKVLIAATAVKLTFGMRKYLLEVFDSIIIYPGPYYSTVNDAWHKGEFNPRMKAIVFSWQDFLEGYQYQNDNLNLGLHEFAHAVHFHGLKSRDASSLIFADMYAKIRDYISVAENLDKLIQSNYFRIYAYTNPFEFIAVILEHFFETPEQFQKEFPELYEKVRKMINFRQ